MSMVFDVSMVAALILPDEDSRDPDGFAERSSSRVSPIAILA